MYDFVRKEVLAEVLGLDVDCILHGNTSLNPNRDAIVYTLVQPRKSITVRARAISGNDFLHECKEWLLDNYIEKIKVENDGDFVTVEIIYLNTLTQQLNKRVSRPYDTELEAVVSMCTWVIKTIKGLNNG